MRKLMWLAAVVLAGCDDRISGPDRTDPDAIQIAYFADLIEAHPSTAAAAYCVSSGAWTARVDPSNEVIADLRRLFGKVQPASACAVTPTGTTYEGAVARSFHIESAVQTGNTAVVTGYVWQNETTQIRFRGELEKQGRLWIVASFQPQ